MRRPNKYSLAFNSTGFDTTIGAGPFGYNKTVGIQLPEGDYTIILLFDKTTDPTAIDRSYDTLKVFSPTETFSAGMKENLFIVGIPDSTEELVKNPQTPLVVRPK